MCVHSGSKPGVPATAPGQPQGARGDRCTCMQRLRAGRARGATLSHARAHCDQGLRRPQAVSGARPLHGGTSSGRGECRWQGPAQQEERSAPGVSCLGRQWAPVHRGNVWAGSLPALGLTWICQGVVDPEGSPCDPLPGSRGRAHGSGNGSRRQVAPRGWGGRVPTGCRCRPASHTTPARGPRDGH